MDAVHGAELVLVEQGVLGFELKEALKLGEDDGFHLRGRREDERTAKGLALVFLRGCGNDRRLLWPDHRCRGFRPQ